MKATQHGTSGKERINSWDVSVNLTSCHSVPAGTRNASASSRKMTGSLACTWGWIRRFNDGARTPPRPSYLLHDPLVGQRHPLAKGNCQSSNISSDRSFRFKPLARCYHMLVQDMDRWALVDDMQSIVGLFATWVPLDMPIQSSGG